MSDFAKITAGFVLLAIVALGIRACVAPVVDKLKAAHSERQYLTEIEIEYRRHFTICADPVIGQLQKFIDCHTQSTMFRKDI